MRARAMRQRPGACSAGLLVLRYGAASVTHRRGFDYPAQVLRVVPSDYKYPSLPFCAVKWVRVRASPVWDRDFVYVEHCSWVKDQDGEWCAVVAVSNATAAAAACRAQRPQATVAAEQDGNCRHCRHCCRGWASQVFSVDFPECPDIYSVVRGAHTARCRGPVRGTRHTVLSRCTS